MIVHAVLDHLETQRDAMVELVRSLARLDTPSDRPASQGAAFELLAEALAPAGLEARHVPGRRSGGVLYARPGDRVRHRPYQLLLGHVDTVWPEGTVEDRPPRVDDGRLRGPGVYDMKAGLVQMVFALRALRELDLPPTVTPVVLVNSDEEIGSRDSTRLIVRLARGADRALVLEPSLGPDGRIKTARKGVGRFEITIRGRAAHAGLDPEGGASAILELSHVIQALFALNDPERGVSVNVGEIDGGLRANVIAPVSRAVVDVRVPSHDQAERIERALRDLAPTAEGVRLEIEGGFGRPPMQPGPGARDLWELARRHGRALGLSLEQATAGGGSDGNTTAQHTPTLDGLGAVGDGAHAEHEYVAIATLPERAALLALLLRSPPLSEAS